MLLFAEHLHEEVLEDVPNRHVVFSLPKRIRAYLRYDRSRNKFLFKAAWTAITELYEKVCPEGTPGAVLALHSGNDLHEPNTHLHGMLADGVFLPDGSFQELSLDAETLTKVFEHKLLNILLKQDIIPQHVVTQIQSQERSGFSCWLGAQVSPTDTEARLFISEYVNKAQIKMSKIEVLDRVAPLDEVKIRVSKDETTSKDYSPLDLLAQLSTFIPDKWEQSVRYLGHYSSRSRGKRRKIAEQQESNDGNSQSIPLREEDSEYKRKKRKSWARLIRKVFEVDPLRCPRCGESMKVIAVITDPKEARRISSHLGYQYRAPPPLLPRESKNSDFAYNFA